jgi:hypothetical protein
MEATDCFSPGIPACSESCELCVVPYGHVGGPPFFQLLVPAPCIAGAADTNMGSPYGGMSIGVHRNLLDCSSAAFFSCVVRSTNRLINNIAPHHSKIQRIVVMKIMNTIHVLNGLGAGVIACGDVRGKGRGKA